MANNFGLPLVAGPVIGVIGLLLMAPCLLAIEGDAGNPFADDQDTLSRDGLAETERRLRVMLADTPMDDESVPSWFIQFLHRKFRRSTSLWAQSTERSEFFRQVAGTGDSDPAEIDYEGFLRLLEGFGSDLLRRKSPFQRLRIQMSCCM